MKFKKIKELIMKLAEDAKKDKKKLALIASSGVVVFGAIGVALGFGMKVHNNTNEVSKVEDLEVQEQSGLESLKKEFYLISVEDISDDAKSEYDAIKERFDQAVAEGDISSARQELKSLRELRNSSTKTDTLVSGVVESTPDNEDLSTEVNVGEVNVSGEQATGVESNTGNSLASSNSSTNSSSSNNGNTSSNSNKNNTSSSSSSNSSSSNTKPTKPSSGNSSNSGSNTATHTHSWVEVYKDVYHEEQGHYENVCVKDAWTESIPVYEQRELSICNGCGKDITGNTSAHMKEQALAGNYACGGYHSEWKQVQVGTNTVTHDAVYEKKWVVDKAAWTEKVLSGYKCNCGATK